MSLGPAGWLPTKATYARVRKRSVGRGNEWHACCSSVRALCRMKKELAGEEEEEEELGCVRRGTDASAAIAAITYRTVRGGWHGSTDPLRTSHVVSRGRNMYVCSLVQSVVWGLILGRSPFPPAIHIIHHASGRPAAFFFFFFDRAEEAVSLGNTKGIEDEGKRQRRRRGSCDRTRDEPTLFFPHARSNPSASLAVIFCTAPHLLYCM